MLNIIAVKIFEMYGENLNMNSEIIKTWGQKRLNTVNALGSKWSKSNETVNQIKHYKKLRNQ